MHVTTLGIVGTGFVADLYMRSLRSFPDLKVVKAFDIDRSRLAAFCKHWSIVPADDLSELLVPGSDPDLILNLTNPASHFGVSKAALTAGKHVYSEKPLATSFDDAQALSELARSKSLLLASAPCSVLGEAAQTVWKAVREGKIGKVRLIYAELDDDFITQAPYQTWRSESGSPWPYRDEFVTGCTLEHAGYYLTWLIAIFGSINTVVSASATTIEDKLADGSKTAPDFSSATLFFSTGAVARLTCSIIAPHNHQLRIIGDNGTLEVDHCWDNHAPVRLRKRFILRRRLINSPLAKRLQLKGPTHPRVKRWGAARMNFALGLAEAAQAIRDSRPCRLSTEFALHLNEVTLALQTIGVHRMRTSCPPISPMPWAE